MSWILTNPNPLKRNIGDCAIRAVSLALDTDWENAYLKLALNGYAMADMPNSNEVIVATLRQAGFYKKFVKDTCPDCYTVKDFCRDFPYGVYVLFCESHVVCVIDGCYYDSWDSGDRAVYFYCYRKE